MEIRNYLLDTFSIPPFLITFDIPIEIKQTQAR